jgi:hypothetical protein
MTKYKYLIQPSLDWSSRILIISFISMLSSILLIGYIDDSEPSGTLRNYSYALVALGNISVILFILSSLLLWAYALRIFFITRNERSIAKNCLLLLCLLGFSWLAGIITYWKFRNFDDGLPR